MSGAMDLMMILMMIFMAGFSLAFAARRVRAAARRALGGPRATTAEPRTRGGD
jgi:hypothetical protein